MITDKLREQGVHPGEKGSEGQTVVDVDRWNSSVLLHSRKSSLTKLSLNSENTALLFALHSWLLVHILSLQ